MTTTTITQTLGPTSTVGTDGRTYTTTARVETVVVDPVTPPIPPAVLSAVITIDGKAHVVSAKDGAGLGNFVGKGFVQRCLRCDLPDLAMSVFFRPDLDGTRDEVVFELGRCFDPANAAAAHLGAYGVKIYKDETLLATLSVPAHYWQSRWRWQSARRPAVNKVEDLIAAGFLPPYQTRAALAPGSAQTYTIMGLAGVTPYMPQTGERPDIGPVTGPQGDFIVTEQPTALITLLAQAEAAGTEPWHMRDENTGAPISFAQYPTASWYPDPRVGSPWLLIPKAPTLPGGPLTVDEAHQPALAYLPYLLTGDPYYLEELQFQATWCIGSQPPEYRIGGKNAGISQARAFAWTTRTLAQCAKVTPDAPPSWLLPQAYWKGLLDQARAMFEKNYVSSTRPERATFRACSPIDSARDEGPTAPKGTWVDFWQDAFVTTVLGWVVRMGFGEWGAAFTWSAEGLVQRTNGTSGWVRAYCTPYRAILRVTATAPFATDWAGAWGLTHSIYLSDRPIPDPNLWVGADPTYLGYTRGALAMAVSLDYAVAKGPFDWSDTQIARYPGNPVAKWSIG